jgi:pimeloyl-ACP methyl ester carboxylesterase
VVRVPKAGHAAHLENPTAFLRVVLGFLDDLET